MSFTKDTFTHFWGKITGLVNSKVNQVQTDIDDIKENYATKTEVDENSVGKSGSGNYSEIFNDYTNNTTEGAYSHAEGYYTTASGKFSHAEGDHTTASEWRSHAEGCYTTASGYASHTEGEETTASGSCSHAQGVWTTASGSNSHAEGNGTTASGDYSHAQGQGTVANSDHQTVIGRYNIPDTPDKVGNGKYALIIGNGEEFGDDDGNPIYSNCFAIDWEGKIYVNNSENGVDLSTGLVGKSNIIINPDETTTIGEIFNDYTNNIAIGNYSHAEGESTEASSSCSHAEGYWTRASGSYSHAQGYNTRASGVYSHAEGKDTNASGNYSHAQGYNTKASGVYSHAQNFYTKASSKYQTAMGKYNTEDSSDKYALIIGNGTSESNRSNCFAVDWEGNIITPKGTISIDLINSIVTRVAALEAKIS